MRLSKTTRLQSANATWGFIPIEANQDDEKELLDVFRNDWSPVLFKNNTRDSANFLSCDCLYADIDNTDSQNIISIEDFGKLFSGINYIISTSKSHQKEKTHGKNKTISPACDRYHVIFPLKNPIASAQELSENLRSLTSRYSFFDKAVSGAAQLFFGNPNTQIIIFKGNQIDLKDTSITIVKHTPITVSEPMEEKDILSTPQNRARLLRALRNSADAGYFEEYADWIAIGMALKAAGFSAQDYAYISDDNAIDAALSKFNSFDPSSVTAGTLIYYASKSTKLNIKSQEDEELISEGDNILSSWLKSEHEERISELVARKENAKAGGIPSNIMPLQGLIKDIAEFILATSIRPMRGLAVAAATAFVGTLCGRKYETETGLGTNLYFVGLAESGSGKEHARKMLKNIAHAAGVSNLMGGEVIASGAGLRSALELHPSRIFLLDEFGLVLEGLNNKNAGGWQRDIVTTLMRLYSAYGTMDYGAEYSDKKMRARVDIESPCCVLYATSTHQTFYNALTGGDGASGSIARMLVINESLSRPDCQEKIAGRAIPEKIIEQVKDLANKNHGGGNLTAFCPMVVPIESEVEKAFFDLDNSMTKNMVSPHTCSVYARVKENAIKLALTYAVSKNFDNPIIDKESFVWGRDISLWCANVLIEKFNDYVADTDHGKTIKKVVRVIQDGGVYGVTGRELLRNVQEIRKQERDEIMRKLLDMGTVFEAQDPDSKNKRFIHSDFYVPDA